MIINDGCNNRIYNLRIVRKASSLILIINNYFNYSLYSYILYCIVGEYTITTAYERVNGNNVSSSVRRQLDETEFRVLRREDQQRTRQNRSYVFTARTGECKIQKH